MSSVLGQLSQTSAQTSPVLARVGQWIVAHPIQALSLSAEEIASRTETSVAAINRFARAAGFDGFADMRVRLGEELDSALEPVEKLKGVGGNSDLTDEGTQKIFAAAQLPEIRLLAERITRCKRVWFLGLGASSCFARYAEHCVMPFLAFAASAAGDGGTEEVARRLSRCNADDVLVALSLPRFSKDTVLLARSARERGAFIAAITGSANTDLLEIAHLPLAIPAEHAILPSSGMGMLAVLESLVSQLVRLNPDAVVLARELAASVFSFVSVKKRT